MASLSQQITFLLGQLLTFWDINSLPSPDGTLFQLEELGRAGSSGLIKKKQKTVVLSINGRDRDVQCWLYSLHGPQVHLQICHSQFTYGLILLLRNWLLNVHTTMVASIVTKQQLTFIKLFPMQLLCSELYLISLFNPHSTVRWCCPPFTEDEAKVQRGEVTCTKEMGFKPRQWVLGAGLLTLQSPGHLLPGKQGAEQNPRTDSPARGCCLFGNRYRRHSY